MQIKIMRHHRRAEDTNADVEHLLIQDNARARDESEGNSDDAWFRENQLDRETRTDGKDERYDERLNVTDTFILKVKHSEHVEGSDDTSPNQRNAKEKLQADRRTDHFGQIA